MNLYIYICFCVLLMLIASDAVSESEPLVASLLLVAMPGPPSSVLYRAGGQRAPPRRRTLR